MFRRILETCELKRLTPFDAGPIGAAVNSRWIAHCEDYAMMIPIVEMATKPVYLPEYLYFHERSTLITTELRAKKDDIIRQILAKPSRTR